MKGILEEIVETHHNDYNCNRYQSNYKGAYGKAPPSCKFEDHPELIQNLLEKIIIGSDCDVEESQSPSDSKESDSTQIETEQPSSRKPKVSLRNKFKSFFKRK